MIHEIVLSGYNAHLPKAGTKRLQLGTAESYGIEKLHITAVSGWEGMLIKATFHPISGSPVSVLVDESGVIDVPHEATATPTTEYNPGVIVFSGVSDGIQRISTNLLYTVECHAPIEGEESSPTESEWAQLVAAYQLKVDKHQGAENAGKVLGIGEDGVVKPVEQTGGSGTGGNVLYIGTEQPTDGTLYWLDTSEDIPVEPDVPIGPEEPEEPEEPDIPDVPDVPVEPDEPVEPEKVLTGISVTYSGGDVKAGTALTALTGITVTATYSDGSTEKVPEYTLSGEIVEGSNVITVSYGGKTATFTVVGVAEEVESNIYKLADIATEIAEGQNATGKTQTGYTRYRIENINAGDIVRLAGPNAATIAGWYDGVVSYKLNDTTVFAGNFMDNYSWKQYTWTADADYEVLYFASNTDISARYPNAVATIEKASTLVTTTSISATYSGGEVVIGTSLDALTGIVVTATYSDGSTATVTKYTLSGTIAEGENTITVNYGNKTTTFTVVGVAGLLPGDADLSESNVYASGTSVSFSSATSSPSWDDFMALTVEKLYFYYQPSQAINKIVSVGARFTPAWGYHDFASNVTVTQATGGTNSFVTNAWDKYDDRGFVVFEIDVPEVQAKVRSLYDDGTLDAAKEKVVSIKTGNAVTGSTVYLLYNYNG